ncbi:phage virion morphogenesis protein [Pelotomaculum propionicicum]|uniref:Phage virion morphogenesis protein n=1 Tax=Pelotomaculum propionicicum TaxID=258475 RepID=A0A4Y7RJI9_9FIRM|nr:phage virion morphogenesis protein [Pelotomaculum propionicicum]TEB09145.1 hypothetical protein Pmgp_03366 [Pelotomaculum propionicicum]
MAGVQLTGDWIRISRALTKLQPAPAELQILSQQLGEILEQSTKERFDTEKGPDGEPWKELTQATLIARARRRTRKKDSTSGFYTQATTPRRGRAARENEPRLSARSIRIMETAAILKDRGRLVRSIRSKARSDVVAVGTNLIYAAIHQFGGPAGRGRKVEIPARPYLGVSEADLSDIRECLEDFIKERTT